MKWLPNACCREDIENFYSARLAQMAKELPVSTLLWPLKETIPVDVITGVIKLTFQFRISFKVTLKNC